MRENHVLSLPKGSRTVRGGRGWKPGLTSQAPSPDPTSRPLRSLRVRLKRRPLGRSSRAGINCGENVAKHNLLQQYKRRLTPAQAAEGIQVAMQNAKSLLADAELLLENERWPRACALAILAIEEAGKPEIIRGVLLARSDEELKPEWQTYRSHIKKNVAWILPRLVSEGARFLEDFRPLFDESNDHASLLEAVKQIAFYSDSCGDCHWSLPSDVIEQKLAETMVSIAKILIPDQPGAMSTEAELELWVKHLRPVWKQNMEAMKSALLQCYAEAEEQGVLSGKHSSEDMAQFLNFYGEAA